MKRIVAWMMGVMMAVTSVGATIMAESVWAAPRDPACTTATPELSVAAGCDETGGVEPLVGKIINLMLYAIGVLAVLMIVWAGVTMTTSAGNPQAVTRAKATMLYAIVGLVVVVLAYAIVNFVVGRVA